MAKKRNLIIYLLALSVTLLLLLGVFAQVPADSSLQANSHPALTGVGNTSAFDRQILNNSLDLLEEGRHTFRFDTFGDETFWGDTLKLHQAIQGSQFTRGKSQNSAGCGVEGRCGCFACSSRPGSEAGCCQSG